MAEDDASFRTSIDLISFGLSSDHGPSNGIPSRMISGLLSADIDFSPRMRVTADEPSALFPVVEMLRPGTAPSNDWIILGLGRLSIDSELIETTEPVKSDFFCIP